jgi:hypothetical protein
MEAADRGGGENGSREGKRRRKIERRKIKVKTGLCFVG